MSVNRNILVVDDERSIRDLFESALGDAGHVVYPAENGETALEILQRHDIELIYLDLKLFGMNGIELCRQIRKLRPVAIIYAMTGWTGLFDIEECREAGFDDYFRKPVSLDLLYRSAEDAFEKLDRWKRLYPGT